MGNNLKFFTSRHAMYYWCSRSCWILNQVSRKSWDTRLFQLDVSSIGNVLPPQRLRGQMAPENHLTPCMCVFSSFLKLTGFWSILPCMFIQLGTHCLVPSRSQKKKHNQTNKQKKIPSRVSLRESKADGGLSLLCTQWCWCTQVPSSGQDCGSWVVQALFSYNWWCMCLIH